MKQLSGFSILNVNGMDRATFTYDEIDESGNLVSHNNKKSLFHHHHTFLENIIFAYRKTQTSHKKWHSKQAIEK